MKIRKKLKLMLKGKKSMLLSKAKGEGIKSVLKRKKERERSRTKLNKVTTQMRYNSKITRYSGTVRTIYSTSYCSRRNIRKL